MNQLLQLQKQSVIVADSGDIQSIINYKPQDATTNPSLILKAAQLAHYQPLAYQALAWARHHKPCTDTALHQLAAERLTVLMGAQMSGLVPGLVSTEVDARLSFDVEKTVKKAQTLMHYYAELGVAHDKVLIKIAATWQGIQAARQLEQQGIHCNLTLLFNLAQACACAHAGVYLISPFVGRISDWYKAQGEHFTASDDPGVLSVKRIYALYKKLGIKTNVMAASFRNTQQILQLTGCDRLTIAPELLHELQSIESEIDTHISQLCATEQQGLPQTTDISEADFLWQMNADRMASDKLAEGICRFAQDSIALEHFLATL